MTDDKGRFIFARNPENTSFLRVDQQTLGYDRIPEMSMPIQIGPTDWTGSELIIPISKASRVSGILESFRTSASADILMGVTSDSLVLEKGIGGAVLQIENDRIRLRTRTSPSGRFEFTQLPPGTYEVSILKAKTNEYQRLELTSIKVILEEGADKELEFRIIPARKKIRMISTSSLFLNGSSSGLSSESTTPSPVSLNESASIEKQVAIEDQKASSPAAPVSPISNAKKDTSHQTPVESAPSTVAVVSATSSVQEVSSLYESDTPKSKDTIERPKWFQLLKQAALEVSKHNDASQRLSEAAGPAPFIPYYIHRMTPESGSNRAMLNGLLFVICLLFLLVDIDLLVRFAVTRKKNGIRSLKDPVWFALWRQLIIYLFAITVATVSWGLLAGISVSLALSGISVAIETRDTYRAIWNIAQLYGRGVKVDTWVVWRDSAVCIKGIGLEAVQASTLEGQRIEIPTHLTHLLIGQIFSTEDAQDSQFTFEISRMANLSHVRSLIQDSLRPLSPSGLNSNASIEFEDIDAQRTLVCITLLSMPSHPAHVLAPGLCEKSLNAAGIPGISTKRDGPISGSAHRGGKAYGPLKLIKGNRAV